LCEHNDDDDDWVLTHNMIVALREGGNDGEEIILHTLLRHLPFVGGVTVLVNKVLSYSRIKRVDSISVRAVEV